MSARIRGIALDVDGVLTDGSVRIDGEGRESKQLSFVDIMGVSLWRKSGLRFALVTGEGGPLLDAIAAKLGIEDVYPHCKDKAGAVRDWAAARGLALAEVCFIGDDVNDVGAMSICGLAAAPPTAHPSVQAAATLVTARPAGAGAVREVIDRLLDDRA